MYNSTQYGGLVVGVWEYQVEHHGEPLTDFAPVDEVCQCSSAIWYLCSQAPDDWSCYYAKRKQNRVISSTEMSGPRLFEFHDLPLVHYISIFHLFLFTLQPTVAAQAHRLPVENCSRYTDL